jgi:hypothetical protein
MKNLVLAVAVFMAACTSPKGECRKTVKHLVSLQGDFTNEQADELYATCKGSEWKDPWSLVQQKCMKGSESFEEAAECLEEGSPVVEEFTRIRDEMCECRNESCAESVNKEFEAWLQKNEKAKGSKGQQEKAKTVAEEYTRCMMSAMALPE